MEQSLNKRDSFTSNLGFILSCVGSAVGMGNIWLFPYRIGQYGGAAFLIPYLIFIVLLGSTGLMGEFAFGTLPNEPAICPKYAPESVAVNALPVIYPTKNRINHPTTIAYPIAIINVPTTGITPNTFPPFFSEKVKNSVRLFFHRSDTIQSVQKFLLG